MKLGRRRNYHKGRAAIRHYANLPEPSFQAPACAWPGPGQLRPSGTPSTGTPDRESCFRCNILLALVPQID